MFQQACTAPLETATMGALISRLIASLMNKRLEMVIVGLDNRCAEASAHCPALTGVANGV